MVSGRRRRLVPVVAGLATGGAALVWYLTLPGRGVASVLQEFQAVMSGSRTLSPAQQQMADIIAQQFAGAGLGYLVSAAIANAYQESRLSPTAAGDHGHSIGLFQLSEYGLGAGMSVAEREDPAANCAAMIRAINGPQGAPLRAAHGRATNAELSSLFAQFIEECAACGHSAGTSELTARANLVTELFGSDTANAVPV